jgi:hypothetical protein
MPSNPILTSGLSTYYPGMALDDNLGWIDHWLAREAPKTHETLMQGATPAALAQLSHRIGVPLLPSLTTLLAWHDGADQTMGGWQLWPDYYFIGCDLSVSAWNLYEQSDYKPPGWWHPHWIPIASNWAGSYLVVDHSTSETNGAVFRADRIDGQMSLRFEGEWWPDIEELVEYHVHSLSNSTTLGGRTPTIESRVLTWPI